MIVFHFCALREV